MRVGPGLRYPIKWVYQRRGLPVEIWREFGPWRFVQDFDGIKGWMHQATLIGRRTFIVTGSPHYLRGSASPHARPVAQLKPGVIGRLIRCAAAASWCEVRVQDYRGWLSRRDFWGILPNEAVSD